MDFNIGFANVNGVLSKTDFIRAEIAANQFDAFGVIETKIDSSTADDELLVPNYSIFLNDRKKGGGGIAAYILSSLPVAKLKSPHDYGIGRPDLETLTLRIGAGAESVIAVFTYIPKMSPTLGC